MLKKGERLRLGKRATMYHTLSPTKMDLVGNTSNEKISAARRDSFVKSKSSHEVFDKYSPSKPLEPIEKDE